LFPLAFARAVSIAAYSLDSLNCISASPSVMSCYKIVMAPTGNIARRNFGGACENFP
jgi:hypothetical protein